jgi:hypothetical protein
VAPIPKLALSSVRRCHLFECHMVISFREVVCGLGSLGAQTERQGSGG